MAKSMLIDSTHPEETRVVVVSGNRLEEFDYETAARKQLKGNIYLAKITRVEPSLQAAFVEYGGSRHGFLPFSEIHPDYYRIPIADRQALIAEEAAIKEETVDNEPEDLDSNSLASPNGEDQVPHGGIGNPDGGSETSSGDGEMPRGAVEQLETETSVETVGGDEVEDAARRRAQLLRRYKIQEVIKRRQVILVQVIKEERGTKGAALTTYLSLAGRYCVLMPNTAKGGGISRKISNAVDRRRLKKIVSELHIPDGMAVIVRTAGSQRSKAEIRRDYEYLLRLWNDIREKTLQSNAPALIHEEANLIKRAIRDLYTRDMDDVLVEGEDGYKIAKLFMRNLMPSHAKNVKLYKDSAVPLFHRNQVEEQLDAMYSSSLGLRSGGYIVINPTEALVAIDVNSGKATKERHIEETALKTNLEAAQEIARQLRLRDLAGLIVIDFIDMEESRHNREVERRLKEAMRHDRARIQLGRISPFGLLELSRQRLRPSLMETSTELCSMCLGTGHVRSTESTAVQVLRSLESEAIRNGAGQLSVTVPVPVALYTFNEKRGWLNELEQRYGLQVRVLTDDALVPPDFRVERISRAAPGTGVREPAETAEPTDPVEAEGEEPDYRRSRRRRHRRREEGKTPEPSAIVSEPAGEVPIAEVVAEATPDGADLDLTGAETGEDDATRRRRRRGKRGGRRRSRRRREVVEPGGQQGAADTVPEVVLGLEVPETVSEEGPVETPASPDEAPRRRSRPARKGRRREQEPVSEPASGGWLSEDDTTSDRAADRRPAAAHATSEAAIAAGIRQPEVPTGESEQPIEVSDRGHADRVGSESRVEASSETAGPTDVATDQRPPAEATTMGELREDKQSSEHQDAKSKRRGWWQRLVN